MDTNALSLETYPQQQQQQPQFGVYPQQQSPQQSKTTQSFAYDYEPTTPTSPTLPQVLVFYCYFCFAIGALSNGRFSKWQKVFIKFHV